MGCQHFITFFFIEAFAAWEMCFWVYTLHAGKWCRWCQWQRPKRMIKRWRGRNTNICIRGGGNPVILCPWMQPNPDPVWLGKTWIYFCWVIFKNKLLAGVTSMSTYLLRWNMDSVVHITSLSRSLRPLRYMSHTQSYAQRFPLQKSQQKISILHPLTVGRTATDPQTMLLPKQTTLFTYLLFYIIGF